MRKLPSPEQFTIANCERGRHHECPTVGIILRHEQVGVRCPPEAMCWCPCHCLVELAIFEYAERASARAAHVYGRAKSTLNILARNHAATATNAQITAARQDVDATEANHRRLHAEFKAALRAWLVATEAAIQERRRAGVDN